MAQFANFERLERLARFYDRHARLEVVGHHTSKSIRLPVVRIVSEVVTIWIRENFYNYAVTVEVATHKKCGVGGQGLSGDNPNRCYFEGFGRSSAPVHPPWTQKDRESHRKFSGHCRGRQADGIVAGVFAELTAP